MYGEIALSKTTFLLFATPFKDEIELRNSKVFSGSKVTPVGF